MESPGTAPGSDPLIASAFISIVPKDKNKHSRVLCQMQTIDASSQGNRVSKTHSELSEDVVVPSSLFELSAV